jgi:hypothetical protein
MEEWRAEQQRQQTDAWSPRQAILNDTGAREPEHTFHQPVPIVARIVWADDGEEFIETVAAGWTGQNVYVRLPDRLPTVGLMCPPGDGVRAGPVTRLSRRDLQHVGNCNGGQTTARVLSAVTQARRTWC